MDKNLKTVAAFTVLYGLLSFGLMALHPATAPLRIADAVGNFEPDPRGAVYLAMARAE